MIFVGIGSRQAASVEIALFAVAYEWQYTALTLAHGDHNAAFVLKKHRAAPKEAARCLLYSM
jgi:hypothetical protein